MKRNIVIAVVTAAALVGGGTATALAVSGDDDGRAVSVDDRRDDDARDGGGQDDQDDNAQDDTRDDADDRRDDEADDRRDDAGDDDASQVKTGGVSAADAIAAALRHTPGTAVAADLDHDDDRGGKAAWEVDVLSGNGAWRSVWVDPGTGKVTGDRAEDEDDTGEVRSALKGATVTAVDAAKAAGDKGIVTSVDLDDDLDGDRNAAWEVETRDGSDWRVDLRSGKVTADRSDDD
ncbi:PepSY domain-containing protein [Streptomyces sp. DH24]|uniref:PepSY domain-containing protein n=1 Tax=Streptomyces sp. DH24 TaxID=3040123 RepID=UPI002441A82E|nr:PepSY domain-containing protein [Streptomyces sp. DH24]MDG9716474.1 PepSY domain-containing protein [Streptomyces sp. DH24]